jgi:hypothetical protein
VALLGSLVPTTVAGHAFWDAKTAEERARQRTQFLKNVGLGGGLILAAVDTEGKPSLGWRARRAAKQARGSVEDIADTVSDQFDDFTDRIDDLAHTLASRLPG